LNSENSSISLYFFILIYIKKISQLNNISQERIEEIIDEVREIASDLKEKNELCDSLINEFSNYKSDSGKTNDQIDDSISNLQLVRKNFEDIIDKLDNVVNNMTDYSESGRKYLY
jgi:uncharacterized coiled-coil DUF342 family protein